MTSPTIQKLRKRAEFLLVRGGSRASKGAVMVEARRRAEDGPIGLGLTASKKVGGAVVRNRARRRLREAARQLLPRHGLPGVDYVLVARQSTPEADWAGLLDDLKTALIRLRTELEAGAPSPRRAQSPSKPRDKRDTPTESD
jgi:ribonuclease P protein component